jgi:hypothetical protein
MSNNFDQGEAKVWMHNGLIEGKMPLAELNKLTSQAPAKFQQLVQSNHTTTST